MPFVNSCKHFYYPKEYRDDDRGGDAGFKKAHRRRIIYYRKDKS
jgi:hypothetical protein